MRISIYVLLFTCCLADDYGCQHDTGFNTLIRNCTNGLYLHNISNSSIFSEFSCLRNIFGPIDIQNTTLSDLSFLKSWSTWSLISDESIMLNLQNNRNMTRLNFPKFMKPSLIYTEIAMGNIENLHPDFCITIAEFIFLFKSIPMSSLKFHAKLCDEAGDIGNLVLCRFTSVYDLPNNCDIILGNVIVEAGDEDDSTKLKFITYLFGSLKIQNTQFEKLDNFKSFTSIASLDDSIPVIQIVGNRNLKYPKLENVRNIITREKRDAIIQDNHPDIFKSPSGRKSCDIFTKFLRDDYRTDLNYTGGDCDKKCYFNDSSITSVSIRKWPKSCVTVCGNIFIDENTDLEEKVLQEHFATLEKLNGDIKVQNSNVSDLDFLSSLRSVSCESALIANNRNLRDVSATQNIIPNDYCLWQFVNNSKLDMSIYDDNDFISNMDSYIYGNLRDNDCVNIRITPESLPFYTNCPFIIGGTNGGLTITNVSDSNDLSGLMKLKRISGNLRIFGTTLTNLSFLSNLQIIRGDTWTTRHNVEIYDNPNLRKLGWNSLQTVLPDQARFAMFVNNSHTDFCFTTNEVQVFAKSVALLFGEEQVFLCSDLDRKDKQKVCHFWNLEYLGEDCRHVIGDVMVDGENEKYAWRLKNVTNIYGSITIQNTQELTNLSFLSNLRSMARLMRDKQPQIRILSNKKLEKVAFPKMKTPPFPKSQSSQKIEIKGNSLELLHNRKECLQLYKSTSTMVTYNGKNCLKMPKENKGKKQLNVDGEYEYDNSDYNSEYFENYGEDYISWDYYEFFDFGSEEYQELFEFVIETSKQIYDVASFISFFVNLLHMFILIRKELRSHLVFIIMMGICFYDILQSFGNILQLCMTWGIIYKIEECWNAYRYSHVVVNMVAKTVQVWSRKCSGLFALYIATIRALSVIFPLSNFVAAMTKIKSGLLVMILMCIASGAWGTVYIVTSKIIKVEDCPANEESSADGVYSRMISRPVYIPYKLVVERNWEIKFLMVDGFMAIFVCGFYLVVALALVIGIRRANKRRKNLGHERSSNASALVMVMAFKFFISEFVYGLIYVLVFVYFGLSYELSTAKQVDNIGLTLQICNSVIHCVICFFMSSQYRDTVKAIFWKKKKILGKREVIASTVESSNKPTSASSSSNRKKEGY